MAWNEPSGDKKPDTPWDGRRSEPDLEQLLRKFWNFVGGGSGGGGRSGPITRNFLLLLTLAAVSLWGLFGLYQLDQQERAVILRLGEFHGVTNPGLRWRPPIIDRIYRINVTKIYSEAYDGKMLTEDENIVDVHITVQYRIAVPEDYVLRVRNPIESLRHATESALRHVVGGSNIDQVITFDRERVSADVKERLQNYLNLYGTGISVSQVNINEANPPQQVKAAFDDVNKALEDEARYKNEAEAYANQVVPEARGWALRELQSAEAHRQKVINEAQGEATRFNQLLSEYQKAPDVTRDRLYLDTVETVFSNVSKVMVDVDEGGNLLYLPLDRLMQPSSNAPRLSEGSAMETDVMQELTERVLRRLEQGRSSQQRRDVRR